MSQNVKIQFIQEIENIDDSIRKELERRTFLAANELRNASQLVLRGARHGRRYNVPGTGSVRYYKRGSKAGTGTITYKKYTASAPGEPPAVRTGIFRMSWQPTSKVVFDTYISRIESEARTDNGRYNLGTILEEGTSRMAPRPYKDRILKKAEPEIQKIYSENYF